MLRRIGLVVLGLVSCLPGVSWSAPDRHTEKRPPLDFAFRDEFQRSVGEDDQWSRVRGRWEVSGIALDEFSTNAFCCRAVGGDALAVTGYPVWRDYRVSVAFRILRPDQDGAGLYFYGDGSGNGIIFRYLAGVFSLVNRDADGERILSHTPADVNPEQWYELGVCVYGDTIVCYLDSREVLRAAVGSRTQGLAGMWAKSVDGTARFDDFDLASVSVLGPRPFSDRKPRINPRFENDKYMKKWALLAPGEGVGILDYTFHRAPTDWLVHSGKWGIQSRWECQPRWTWFGGYGDGAAVIWHKMSFGGDTTVDIYVAFRMDHPFDPDYSHPGDINISLCTDGRDLTSGYTMVLAGWRNRRSCLYRRHDVVAELSGPLLPDNRNTFPYRELHIPWYHVRMERCANTVRCFYEEKEVLTFEDPNPLSGDRLAVWTWNNPLLIARARVQADAISAPVLPAPIEDETGETVEKTLGPFVPGRDFRYEFPHSGVSLRETPRLRFEYRASPRFMANLYLRTQGRVHQYSFSAPSVRSDAIPVAGRFLPPVLDGQWHTAQVDVISPLRDAYRTTDLEVEEIWLGLEADDPYLLVGFGGNASGATCSIRDVEWLQAENSPPASSQPQSKPPGLLSDTVLVNQDFALGTVSCRAEGGIDGPTLLWDPWNGSEAKGCLDIVNSRLGGCFTTVLWDEPFSPLRWPVFAFDYRITDGLRVDLVVRTVSASHGPRAWTVKFCDYDDTFPVIGNVANVEPDGCWHHAEINLHDCLRAAGAGDDDIVLLELSSGGYPGNEAGTRFRIDNLRISRPPDERAGDDHDGPEISVIEPAPSTCSGNGLIRLEISDSGSGVDWASLRLQINGAVRHVADPAVSIDRETGIVEWCGDADFAAPRLLVDGGLLRCEVSVSDLAGNPASHISASHFVRFLDARAPSAPYITYVPGKPLLMHTFEGREHVWGDWGGCSVQTTERFSATGRRCLALTKFDKGNTFQALADIRVIPLDEYPLISFDVMAPTLPAHGDRHPHVYHLSKLFFDGERDRQAMIGSLPELVPGRWTRVEFDMRETNTEAAHDPYGILLKSGANDGKPPGLTVYIDNFCIYSADTETISFEWSAPGDVSGITGYSWALDRDADTVPIKRVMGVAPSVSLSPSGSGEWWFHVRAMDGAGNWGETAHCGPVRCGTDAR